MEPQIYFQEIEVTRAIRTIQPRFIGALTAALLLGCVTGCAVVAVADAAVSVAATAVKVGATVVGTTVDVAASGVKAVAGSSDKKP
jgi:hypothetical protein